MPGIFHIYYGFRLVRRKKASFCERCVIKSLHLRRMARLHCALTSGSGCAICLDGIRAQATDAAWPLLCCYSWAAEAHEGSTEHQCGFDAREDEEVLGGTTRKKPKADTSPVCDEEEEEEEEDEEDEEEVNCPAAALRRFLPKVSKKRPSPR